MKNLLENYLAEKDLTTDLHTSLCGSYGLLFSFLTERVVSTAHVDHEGYFHFAIVDLDTGEEVNECVSSMEAINDGLVPHLQEMCAACTDELKSWHMLDESYAAIVGDLGKRWAKNWQLSGYTSKFSGHPVLTNFPLQLFGHTSSTAS